MRRLWGMFSAHSLRVSCGYRVRGHRLYAPTLPMAAGLTGTPAIRDQNPDALKQDRVSKIDLLFMIDNSSSMADKQAHLGAGGARSGRTPRQSGVRRSEHRVQQVGDAQRQTARAPRASPTSSRSTDIHIGIISSSLGGHGSTGVCDQPDPRKTFPHNDDKGHLSSAVRWTLRCRRSATSRSSTGTPPAAGTRMPQPIAAPFTTMVTGVGQHGCGYEASLEAIYRFLIDPDPYDSITINKSQRRSGWASRSSTVPTPPSSQQRADFLRPDSLVAIIMVDRRERLLDHRRRPELLRHRARRAVRRRGACSRTARRRA